MFPRDWSTRSLIVAGVAFLLAGVGFCALAATTSDGFAWFLGITTTLPAIAMLIDARSRRSMERER